MVVFDHNKKYYLSDLRNLKEFNVITDDCIIVADNMLRPKAEEYLNYFKESTEYESVLYHSFTEYTEFPDAMLISRKIPQKITPETPQEITPEG